MKKNQILLPQSPKEFDALVKKLVKKYKLPNEDHASAVLANRIMHLPVDQATVTLEYLGNCILKNVAFQVAQAHSTKIQHKMQVDQIVAALNVNPNDQQAIDALQKAINDGSEYAKTALEKIDQIEQK